MKKKVFAFLKELLFYVLGSIVYSFAVSCILSPAQISPGGVTGVATALNFLFEVPVGITALFLNAPLFFIGWRRFGTGFVAKTIIATAISSFFIDLFDAFLPNVDTDRILSAVFGGVLMGLGIGIILLKGATTGGTDIAAKLINKRFPHVSVGRCVLFSDAIVVLFSAIVYGNVESALLSVITIYASTQIMDGILYGADRGKVVFAISKTSDEIAKKIMSEIGRGVTFLSACGGYTGQEMNVLMCAVRHHQVAKVHSIINGADEKAFVMVLDAGEILGEGFKI